MRGQSGKGLKYRIVRVPRRGAVGGVPETRWTRKPYGSFADGEKFL